MGVHRGGPSAVETHTTSRCQDSSSKMAGTPPAAVGAATQADHFCLRWNNYQTNMTAVFDQLLQEEVFVDVTLSCEGGAQLRAHKVVLAACSPYFQAILQNNPCKHPIIIMPRDVGYNDLRAIIEFVYRGEIDVAQEQINSLLQAADHLKIKGLCEVGDDPTHVPPGFTATPTTRPPPSPHTPTRGRPPFSRGRYTSFRRPGRPPLYGRPRMDRSSSGSSTGTHPNTRAQARASSGKEDETESQAKRIKGEDGTESTAVNISIASGGGNDLDHNSHNSHHEDQRHHQHYLHHDPHSVSGAAATPLPPPGGHHAPPPPLPPPGHAHHPSATQHAPSAHHPPVAHGLPGAQTAAASAAGGSGGHSAPPPLPELGPTVSLPHPDDVAGTSHGNEYDPTYPYVKQDPENIPEGHGVAHGAVGDGGQRMTVTPELLGLMPAATSSNASSHYSSDSESVSGTPGGRKMWTDEDMDKALDALRNSSMSLSKAAHIYGIPATTLWQRAHRMGIETPKKEGPNKTWSEHDLAGALEELRSGRMSANRASKEFGIPNSTLYKIARKEGIKLSSPFSAIQPSWSIDDLNKALESIRGGMSVQKAAQEYGIPTGTLYGRCRREGIELSKYQGVPWSEEDMKDALDAVGRGEMSINQAAIHFNLPYSSLYGRFKRGKYEDGIPPPHQDYLHQEMTIEHYPVSQHQPTSAGAGGAVLPPTPPQHHQQTQPPQPPPQPQPPQQQQQQQQQHVPAAPQHHHHQQLPPPPPVPHHEQY
ncbi:uncharacterized protein LOC143036810 isoform X2 [Oratosquilla oratoria]|uniref:uncharacterized protein LOC143036810 isoform X2 n=1 Tax=Oratosquilla oratoria TaxID=337810 RepID=UPI003F774444